MNIGQKESAMFDKLKDSMRFVSKKPSAKPLGWVDDLFMQAKLAKREGLTEPLSISIKEVEDLMRYREVVMAAEEFWEYHKGDIDWLKDDHVTRFMKVMRDIYAYEHEQKK